MEAAGAGGVVVDWVRWIRPIKIISRDFSRDCRGIACKNMELWLRIPMGRELMLMI